MKRRSRRRLRNAARSVRNRTNVLLVIALAIALISAIQMLMLIGPPPWPRIDELWVHAHRGKVRVLVVDLLIAAGATVLLALPRIGMNRSRFAAVAMWAAAVWIIMNWFGPTASIVARVVLNQAL